MASPTVGDESSMERAQAAATTVNRAAGGGGNDGHHQRPVFEAEQQREFDEAIRVLTERGHHGLVQRVFQILDQRQYHEAMRVLNDDNDQEQEHYDDGWEAWDPTLDEFRARLAEKVHLMLDDVGYDENETFGAFHILVLMAARETAGFRDRDRVYDDDDDMPHYSYSDGGFGAVPAPAAAVAGLEKRTIHLAGGGDGCAVTEYCSICFEGFVDGGEVSVMPCPSRGHEFHTECIVKWLGVSNMCPLCRHGLGSSSAPAPAPASSMVADEPVTEQVSTATPHDLPTRVERWGSGVLADVGLV